MALNGLKYIDNQKYNNMLIMKNEVVLDIILCLISGYNKLKVKGCKKDIGGLRYLLGQSIRQYDIPKKNYHISEGAKKRWEELSSDPIEKYWYRKKVECNKLQFPKLYKVFRGSESEGKEIEIKPGGSFIFRDMFHEEHIIPVALILDKMINETNSIDRTAIQNLLENMHMCIILKEEDRDINHYLGRTARRTLDFASNVKNIYDKRGIKLLPYAQFP